MGKNTVFRVLASNTTKAEKRRREAIAEREREERRPRLERANPKAVPLTRKAYREIMDPSKGQGNDERFLSDAALTALTVAAGATSVPAAVASTVPVALKFRSDLENLGVETALTDPNNLMLLAGMIRGPGAVRQTRWYHDLVNRYGTRDAEAAAKFISTDAFKNFFWQGDPASVVRESGMYSTVRDIIKKIGGSPDEGKALIGGSASINKFGTIHRPSAVAHDLDIDSYIGGASKRPWEPIPGPDYVTDAWYDKFVGPLERPGAVEASPILQRIREQFPKTHANAPILEWDDAMWKDNVANRYKEGVFQKINNFPDVYPQFTGRQFIGTRINGVPVDIFLADTRINQVPGSVYAPPETAFEYKRMYAEENALNGRPPRPKDVADFESYRPFSRENPVVDPETGRAQFSPSNFGDQILTEENLPAVSNVETYPGSGEAVPMIMNTRGQMVYPFSDAVLRQDAKGGETNRWGGNLQSEGRPLYLFRDDKGKTTGYGTTESIIIPGVGEQAGQFVVAPTIVNGKKLTNEQAAAHYQESGEYWAAKPTAEEADRTAQEVHEDHARIYGPQWNEYIEAHPDELSETLKAEIEESKKAEVRQDAKGGDAGGEVTENAEIVSSGEVADTPVTNGPRIVINPTTFRNGKDALCVAFNERFRVFMEASGYEPQSEPTEDQRRFFADTAYADDELMLRRTILARIATLDTSVKDPTDAQISDTLQMLRQFKETERPDDAWQANALDRIIGLVQAVEPSVQPATGTASAAAQ